MNDVKECQPERVRILKRICRKIESWFYHLKERFKILIFRLLFKQKRSNLVKHAIREMKLVGLHDKDADYGGMLYYAILDLMRLFSSQGHSGFSAGRTLQIFNHLGQFKNLSPLTNNPKEWTRVHKNRKGKWVYQNKRCCSCFTENLKTYYSVDDKKRIKKRLKDYRKKKR
jgi:hypothetical protein